MSRKSKHVLYRLIDDVGIRGMSVLDVGCGHGTVSSVLIKSGVKVLHGVDIRDGPIEEARDVCKDFDNAIFWVADLGNCDSFFANNNLLCSYDLVVCLGVLHHVPPETRYKSLRNLLNITSRFFVIRTGHEFMLSFTPKGMKRIYYNETKRNGTQAVFERTL